MASEPTAIRDFTSIPAMLDRAAQTWPEREAFREFSYAANQWVSTSWAQFYARVQAWRKGFAAMGLQKGDRVAMLLTNSLDAVTFDAAALSNGLIPVPLHAIDTPGSCAYILKDSNARALVLNAKARWNAIYTASGEDLPDLDAVVLINETRSPAPEARPRVLSLTDWLADGEHIEKLPAYPTREDIAGFIYTSGTTGRPKGVMVTHGNILSNVEQFDQVIDISRQDIYLSYLPFSHTFRRCGAFYSAMAHGAAMAFARSVNNIEHDLMRVRPTLMCSVPRIYERIYQKCQEDLHRGTDRDRYLTEWMVEVGWRQFALRNDLPVETSDRACLDDEILPILDREVGQKVRALFGGRLRYTFAGGASLNYTIAKFFSAMGIQICQANGLTETSPFLSINTPQNNHPATVGFPLPNTQVRIGENDELQVKGPQVMLGYWNKPVETAAAFTPDGWFKTGDQADLSDGGRVRIKGRIKEIVVTSTGEKVAPVDLEFAIQADHLFEQALIVGENRPFITALVVVNDMHWRQLCSEFNLDADDPATLRSRDIQRAVLKRIMVCLKDFPKYGVPRAVGILRTPWTIENDLLTPTLKLKRPAIMARFSNTIESLYATHML